MSTLHARWIGCARAAALLLIATSGIACAAELKILAGSAVEPAMNQLIPAFEKASGHTVTHDFNGAIGQMTKRVLGGEAADVVIVSAAQIDTLLEAGTLLRGSRTDIAKVAIGVFVRKGAPKPDITSVESFKRTMLAAKSIGWNDPAAGAPVSLHMIGVLQRLGIAAEMHSKTVAFKQRSDRFAAVARGDVEIGFNQISEIIAAPGVDLVGPVPHEIQNFTLFAAGVAANSRAAQASRAFITFISSPESQLVWTAKGFDPP
jgi:molybdate transport system substrate-binding protein